MKKTSLLLIGALSLALALSGSVTAAPVYVQSMTVGEEIHWGLTQWTGLASSLEDAVTGAPDYVPYDPSDPDSPAGDALGWQQGWGNYVLDFGETFTGTDVEITFWHFGGYDHSIPPVANEVVYMYVSEDGANWTPNHVDFDPSNTDGWGGRPRGAEGDVQLEDVLPGGETVYETTYNLSDTFGVESFRYLMIEKINGGPKTGKFIDAVGVDHAVPVPGTGWLLGIGLLVLVGLSRRNCCPRKTPVR
jgi:hypothetical protein